MMDYHSKLDLFHEMFDEDMYVCMKEVKYTPINKTVTTST